MLLIYHFSELKKLFQLTPLPDHSSIQLQVCITMDHVTPLFYMYYSLKKKKKKKCFNNFGLVQIDLSVFLCNVCILFSELKL